MGKRASLKYVAIQRLNSLMAIGEKRSEAKAAARARGEDLFAFTDGKIRSFQTRTNYQKIIMQFINWCRNEHGVRDNTEFEARSDELASLYLRERLAAGKSAWTLKTERSALRMYFGNRRLTESVKLPRRKREHIKRSRGPAVRDTHINLDNWQHVVQFCLACGLRREELRDLHVRDVYVRRSDQRLVVRVVKGKGGKWREVPVFPGREDAVLRQIASREPDAHVFDRVSGLLDIHSFRRQFAQDLYEFLSGRPLPPVFGRLRSPDLDLAAALEVSRALGHNRVDIIFGHYLR
jgi:integrase